MPNPQGIKKYLPETLYTKQWSCCGDKGFELVDVYGVSMWALKAVCHTCHRSYIITKRGLHFGPKPKR